ncbi:hypothetical protein LR48_Vigan621s000700 [Vigna angularis]|uniref:Uncharacterized protein n=1 Tax=Phaseolus angularis TaxID=3914 RepID=A0A0L9TEC8_PHAAN|nr:hypothetical protein LR48_Vigan621s000700 [Vigna angularis]
MLLDSWWVLGVVEFGASFVVVSDPETLILSPSTLSSLPSILSSPNPISTTINLVVSRKPPWPPPLEPQITVIFNHHRESSIDTVKTLAIDEKKVGVGTLFSPLSSVSDVGKSPKLRGSLEKEERPVKFSLTLMKKEIEEDFINLRRRPFSLVSGYRRLVLIATRFLMKLRLARGSIEVGERHFDVGCEGCI